MTRRAFTAFAVSLVTLSPVAFYFKSPLVFYRFDGTYLLILARMQETWASSRLAFVSNPLQGIGGLALLVFLLIYFEQTALLYIFSTLGVTVLLVIVALADLGQSEQSADADPAQPVSSRNPAR